MNRRRGLWLALAVVLLALGAGLMLSGQGEETPPEPREVVFPRRMRREDWKRAEQRRTQVVQAAAAVPDAGVAAEPQRPRDPVLAALPRGKGKSAFVIEANALRYSPVGELLLDCIMRDGGKKLDEFRKMSGVDPLQDLDRLVITDKGMVVSGNFAKARFAELMKDRVSSDYGPRGRVYEYSEQIIEQKDGTTRRVGRPAAATWNDQMLVIGDDTDSVKEVLERVEGGGSDEPPVISEGSTYGEMYGVLSVDDLVRMLPPDQAELGQRLKEVAENVEFHMDASSDVALVADIVGADSDQVTDLGKSIGAALSVARLQAQAEGNADLAQMLDFAKVHPGGRGFSMELAVPLDVIKERLAFCRDERQAAEAGEAGKTSEATEDTQASEAQP